MGKVGTNPTVAAEADRLEQLLLAAGLSEAESYPIWDVFTNGGYKAAERKLKAMGLDQWKIDFAAWRRAARPQENPDAPLDLPGVIWADPLRGLHGWRPPEYVEQPDARELWTKAHAQALRAEVLARIEQGLVERARAAMDASTEARAALAELEAQQRADEADTSDQAALRALVTPRRIEAARQAAEQAAATVDQALGTLRAELVRTFEQTVRDREYATARQQDEQAAELERQAGDRRLAVVNARSMLEAFLPSGRQ